jgi:hypothetical protein
VTCAHSTVLGLVLSNEQDGEPLAEVSLNVLIGSRVMRSLGTQKDTIKAKVHPLGGGHYRVNILRGKDFATGRIAHSFFLAVDEKGKIVSSTPKIVKMY